MEPTDLHREFQKLLMLLKHGSRLLDEEALLKAEEKLEELRRKLEDYSSKSKTERRNQYEQESENRCDGSPC